MTEDEAKTKWCPFARVAYDGECGNRFCAEEHNRIALNPASSRCIGSNCMAWRYVEGFSPEETKQGDKTSGYCGLAAKL